MMEQVISKLCFISIALHPVFREFDLWVKNSHTISRDPSYLEIFAIPAINDSEKRKKFSQSCLILCSMFSSWNDLIYFLCCELLNSYLGLPHWTFVCPHLWPSLCHPSCQTGVLTPTFKLPCPLPVSPLASGPLSVYGNTHRHIIP